MDLPGWNKGVRQRPFLPGSTDSGSGSGWEVSSSPTYWGQPSEGLGGLQYDPSLPVSLENLCQALQVFIQTVVIEKDVI